LIRKLGFVSYVGRIVDHKPLLDVVLLDPLSEHKSREPLVVFNA
jgi:hypothetical protein